MISSRVFTQPLRRAAMAPRAAIAVPRTPIARRTYAEQSGDVKPPVALFGVDGTYASALYTAAVKSSTLDATARSLANLNTAFRQDSKLQPLIADPTLSTKDKDQIINELVKAAGAGSGKDADTLKNLLHTMADNNRLSALEGVCDKFGQLMSAHRGEVEMVVTSAAQLDNKVLKQLEQAVGKSRLLGSGQKLKVVPKVQPDIRGGLIVEIGDRTIDLSVASRMSKMNKLLMEQL